MNKIYRFYAKMFGKPIFLKWNLRLFRFALSGLGILNHYNNELSGETYFIEKVLPKYFNDNPTIFDVGANIGSYSKLLKEIHPGASLHLFEPHPQNYELIIDSDLSSSHVNNIALSDQEGSTSLYDYNHKDGSSHASIYRGVIENIHKSKAIKYDVRKDTVDNYAEKYNIKQIDLLKIDVEGHEMKVLQGAGKLIRSGKIKLIHFEFNEMNVESRVFMKDFFDYLKEYSFYRMLPNSLMSISNYSPTLHEIFAFQNIVAIHKELDKENYSR